MLQSLNIFLQRSMAVFTPLCLVLGVIFNEIGQHFIEYVIYIFALMTFIGGLSMTFKEVKVVRKYPKIIFAVIAFLHILMPIWAYILSHLIFNDELLIIGYVVSVAVPTGVTSMIWVTMARGNISLALSIILIDTLFAPIIMPLLVKMAVGQVIHIDSKSLILDLIWMIVVPSILGIVVNELTKGKLKQKWNAEFALISKLCLFSIVFINSSAVAPFLTAFNVELVKIILLVLALVVSGYVFAFAMSQFLMRMQKAERSTFLFTSGMRNISLGVVVATHYFPPKVAMPVVFGMLFQQMFASFVFNINERMK